MACTARGCGLAHDMAPPVSAATPPVVVTPPVLLPPGAAAPASAPPVPLPPRAAAPASAPPAWFVQPIAPPAPPTVSTTCPPHPLVPKAKATSQRVRVKSRRIAYVRRRSASPSRLRIIQHVIHAGKAGPSREDQECQDGENRDQPSREHEPRGLLLEHQSAAPLGELQVG